MHILNTFHYGFESCSSRMAQKIGEHLLSDDCIDQLCASNLQFLLWIINYWSLTEHLKPAASGDSSFFLCSVVEGALPTLV